MSLVTMFTDASWSSAHKIAVWAMWAKMDGETIRFSGKFNTPMPQSGAAELGAISYGLSHIAQNFNCPAGSKIICQTDSTEAINAINNNKHRRQLDTAIILHIKDMARANGWTLDFRHVKGHMGDATPRNAVNTWCDKECRRQMDIALAAIQETNVVKLPKRKQANG